MITDLIAKIASHQYQSGHTLGDELLNQVRKEWSAVHVHHRLRNRVGKWPKPLTEAPAEDCSLTVVQWSS
ncbi:MAG: hypothetical protein P8J30_03195 [Ilumatobacter sp.]|jgi:hypothetical protein|nr:hypothetical protein [Ilumatobacter sp.]